MRLVLDALAKAEFYLEREKCNLYAEKLDCLGHMIDERGVHADTDKMARICEWRKPRNLNEVQQFVGLVEYSTVHARRVGIHHTAHGHPEEWSPFPLARNP